MGCQQTQSATNQQASQTQLRLKEKSDVTKLQKLAEQGDIVAQSNLGVIYDLGYGVYQDTMKAVYWYTKAANQGDVAAQFTLGDLYHKGSGVPQDYNKAIYWYTKAASQDYAFAQYAIATMYEKGQGVPQDYAIAKEWYDKACDIGFQSSGCDEYKTNYSK